MQPQITRKDLPHPAAGKIAAAAYRDAEHNWPIHKNGKTRRALRPNEGFGAQDGSVMPVPITGADLGFNRLRHTARHRSRIGLEQWMMIGHAIDCRGNVDEALDACSRACSSTLRVPSISVEGFPPVYTAAAQPRCAHDICSMLWFRSPC